MFFRHRENGGLDLFPDRAEDTINESATHIHGKETGYDGKADVWVYPIIVVDPINFFFDYRDSRFAIAELFETFYAPMAPDPHP